VKSSVVVLKDRQRRDPRHRAGHRTRQTLGRLGEFAQAGVGTDRSGDVYPVRRGSKMWMQKASVAEIVQHDRTQPPLLVCQNPAGRKVTIQNLDNCIVVGG